MRRVRLQPRWHGGFTLMETLVALALLLVLVGMVFAFGMNLTASRDRLSKHIRQSQAVRVFLDRLEQDLHTSLAADAGQGVGIVGDESSLRLLSRSVGSMGQTQGISIAMRDLQRSEYRWNAGSRTLEASRGAVAAESSWSTIADDLGFVQWRYHNGSSWVNRFDSGSTKRLPVAVEVAIWFVPPPQDPSASPPDERSMEDEPDDPLAAMFGSPEPASPDSTDEPRELADETHRDWPPPDRVRLIIIPDAPDFEYGRSYSDDPDGSFDAPAPLDAGGAP